MKELVLKEVLLGFGGKISNTQVSAGFQTETQALSGASEFT